MLEGLKNAMEYVVGLSKIAEDPKVLEIEGKTYCNKDLIRYGEEVLANAIKANTLTAIVDYIKQKPEELRGTSILQVVSPSQVKLYSGLLEDQRREYLFQTDAIVNEFNFDKWYDQERFIIELQANFIRNEDIEKIMLVAGNIKAGTTANYDDDGISQKTTIKSGIANNSDVIVPNPVRLRPYRTFNEIEQPESAYVFRIRDIGGEPNFKLVEAEGGVWKNLAMKKIKEYLEYELADELKKNNITVIA